MHTVLFDGDCMLCRSLAAYAERRAGGSMHFISWQKFYVGSPHDFDAKMFKNEAVVLRVLIEGRELDGAEAWAWLLEKFPDLAGLNWLAEKLNIQSMTAAALHTAGTLARSLCRRCRRPLTERS